MFEKYDVVSEKSGISNIFHNSQPLVYIQAIYITMTFQIYFSHTYFV